MNKQVVAIHGGDAHNSYKEYISELKREKVAREDFMLDDKKRWRTNLPADLGPDYEVFLPDMPNSNSAKYTEWKIWFDKVMDYIEPGAVFVGHSLGGIFLARYFAENTDNKVRGVFLIAPPYKDPSSKDKIADFMLPRNTSKLAKLGKRLYIYHSEDDPVVAYSHLKKYLKIVPDANVMTFKDRGHFRQEKIPELVADIKKLFA